MEKTITLTREELFASTSMLVDFDMRMSGDDGPDYESVRLTEQIRPLIDQLTDEAISLLRAESVEVTATEDDIQITLLPGGPEQMMKSSATGFISQYVAGKWFAHLAIESLQKNAKAHLEMASQLLLILKNMYFMKETPEPSGSWPSINI